MKKHITLIVFFAFLAFATAQDFKFGKVSKAELQEKGHPLDSSANAAVLYKKEHISFQYIQGEGFTQQREVHERIKIYNKEGYDWATEKIFLYQGSSGGSKENVTNLKGYTYNLEGGKIVESKLKKDGIFEEDYNDFTKIKTITLPNIQDACVIEYTYKIKSPFYEIDDIYFQKSIPINTLEVKIATPQYMRYNRRSNLKAFYFPKLMESKENKSVTLTSSSRSGFYVSKTNFNVSKDEYYDNVIKISERNIPAIKAEAYAGNMDNYIAKLSLELSASLNQYGAIEKSYSSTWEKVSKSIYERTSFGKQLTRKNFFKDDIEPLMEGVSDPFKKALVLQNYVKSKVRWNGYYGVSAYKGIKDAYKESEGNVGDINLLLIAMLKSQGVEANPVLVSTKDNGIPLFPTQKGFNYVICMVEKQDQYVLIDATEKFSSLNVLPERVLNWQGRLIKDDGSSSWVSLVPSKQSQEFITLNVKLEDDLTISGKLRQLTSSNLALRKRKKNIGLSQDEKIKAIESGKGDIQVSNLEFENKENNMFSVTYDYLLDDAIDEIGNQLYFSPLLFLRQKKNPFKLEERKYPIDFIFPYRNKYSINIMLPEGYKIEELPKSEIFKFSDSETKFSFIIRENGKFIRFQV
ncbi:DUF3857 domain-containing protein [Winogradskyella sp.]|uniref:DUF3857 domain-containing protein n=1 Tax=Winogradskyella sp. TaxID=1883156 RepID=UPI0025FE95E1|nr:DUF3857 domain-containing protein [Winogradskyella sp.]MBT8244085.1 DUF3857 and transglutaminase domain-containing protein [Winogradskyella sp.]